MARSATVTDLSGLAERGLRAYGRAYAVLEPIRLRFLEERGLTMAQLRLLVLIGQETGTSITELADAVRVKPATLTGLADRLERQTLIQRSHDLTDRRVVRLSLTAAGREVLDEVMAARAQVEKILAVLDAATLESFVASLEAFSAAADRVLGDPACPD